MRKVLLTMHTLPPYSERVVVALLWSRLLFVRLHTALIAEVPRAGRAQLQRLVQTLDRRARHAQPPSTDSHLLLPHQPRIFISLVSTGSDCLAKDVFPRRTGRTSPSEPARTRPSTAGRIPVPPTASSATGSRSPSSLAATAAETRSSTTGCRAGSCGWIGKQAAGFDARAEQAGRPDALHGSERVAARAGRARRRKHSVVSPSDPPTLSETTTCILSSESPNSPASFRVRRNAREKLTRLTRQQFQELSTDVYDELMRRIEDSNGGQPGQRTFSPFPSLADALTDLSTARRTIPRRPPRLPPEAQPGAPETRNTSAPAVQGSRERRLLRAGQAVPRVCGRGCASSRRVSSCDRLMVS